MMMMTVEKRNERNDRHPPRARKNALRKRNGRDGPIKIDPVAAVAIVRMKRLPDGVQNQGLTNERLNERVRKMP